MRLTPLLAAFAASLTLAAPLAAQGQGARLGSEVAAGAPQRVVSMNLCTDQLAMMLAAPGQLLAVSELSADPRMSALADEAEAIGIHHGRAEEIWLLQPDLVIAGSFSNRATVEMLRRLGVPVAVLSPAYALEDIPQLLRDTGAALGRDTAAEAAVTAYEDGLAALREEVARRPRAALYYANGYTSGDRTLAGGIIAAAGFANIAAEEGFASGGFLPLETLVMTAPEALITGRPYPGASRSEEILSHPVLRHLQGATEGAVLTDRDWICGTPTVLNAIAEMRAIRREMTE